MERCLSFLLRGTVGGSPPPFCVWFLLCVFLYIFRPMVLWISLVMLFFVLIAGCGRVIPLEMLLRGRFQGNC